MAAVPVSVSRSVPSTRRPDPAQGVFETLLVRDGRPVELAAHLARLRASLAALYPDLTLPRLDVPVDRGPDGPLSTGTSVEALRITVAPGRGELSVTAERRPATGHFATENGGKVTSDAVSLLSVPLPGGLGAHKWVDRSLLDEAQARLPSDALPLIVDEDGSALEASRANVFAVRDGALLTPPADGRILPGVTRMRVLELAGALGIEAREPVLPRDDLLAADEVFLTGSVRGIEPAVSLDGVALAGGGEIAARLAAGLRHAWTGLKTTASFG
ncbi:MAG TPA: aminotransferase class IV [Solirubrobacterales bacterium]|nr:aminotransferase class IV [Solirubrobacterales bacterium]